MKKLLLLLPMIATVSMYGMDNPADFAREINRKTALMPNRDYDNEIAALLNLRLQMKENEYPYKGALNDKKPLTRKQELAAAGYPGTVDYETGKTIAEFFSSANK